MDEMNTSVVIEPEEKKKEPLIVSVYDWVEVVCIASILVILIFTFIGRIATVIGSSMTNTLYNGDRLIVSNLFYTPECGDIVIVQKESGHYADSFQFDKHYYRAAILIMLTPRLSAFFNNL